MKEELMNRAVLEQYNAVKSKAGWRDLSHRGKVKIVGPDYVSFFHAMISNEVQGLPELFA